MYGARPLGDHTLVYERLRKFRILDVQTFGIYDSGTNLLEDVIGHNFLVCKRQGGTNYVAMTNTSDTCIHHNRWAFSKHINPNFLLPMYAAALPLLHGRTALFVREETVVITISRDPMAQIQGWKKAPYDDLRSCTSRGEGVWLTACKFCTKHPDSRGAKCGGNKAIVGGEFESLPDIWNAYNTGYIALNDLDFKQVINTRYEDLVFNPKMVIERISEVTNMPMPSNIQIPSAPAKAHGKPHGLAKAKMDIEKRTFMLKYSEAELRFICERLKTVTVAHFNYTTSFCAKFHVPRI